MMRQLLDIVNQTVQVPLRVHFSHLSDIGVAEKACRLIVMAFSTVAGGRASHAGTARRGGKRRGVMERRERFVLGAGERARS